MGYPECVGILKLEGYQRDILNTAIPKWLAHSLVVVRLVSRSLLLSLQGTFTLYQMWLLLFVILRIQVRDMDERSANKNDKKQRIKSNVDLVRK